MRSKQEIMRFLLDTNILIPLEDSQIPLNDSLANFVRLAHENTHILLYHPASIDDINEDKNPERKRQTLQRLEQYSCLDFRPECPWNEGVTKRNDIADNEILYSLSHNAAHALVTEDRGIHDKAKGRGLVDQVYTIQTAEDLLKRLHERQSIELPNIEEIPLYQITPQLNEQFFDSLRDGYPEFNKWFIEKSQDGRRAWVCWNEDSSLGGLCIYAHQHNEQVTLDKTLNGESLKLSTFKVGEASRGKKIGELFLKAAFRYASFNNLEHIFIHGDEEQHHFLFEMLQDFGFEKIGVHVGGEGRDAVYVKYHPNTPPDSDIPPFKYMKRYYPHYLSEGEISKFIVPIRPEFHQILFPDCSTPTGSQFNLFSQEHSAGNAIKLAYLSHAQTKIMDPGSIVLFYRSEDYQTITSIGVVESYETLENPEEIAALVKRRTVYSMDQIQELSDKPTKVMLFWLICHLDNPKSYNELITEGVFTRAPQSITKISHEKYKKIIENG